MQLILLEFFGALSLFCGLCTWALSGHRGITQIQMALLGLASAPALLSISVYLGFIPIPYIFPSRLAFIFLPLVVAGGLAWRFGRRPCLTVDWQGLQFGAITGGILVLAIGPFFWLLWASVSNQNTPHDLSIYLLQAIDLSRIMQTGTATLGGWWSYSNSLVSQPHSISFPLFLAWGFLFVDAPGYGADLIPKVLVAWTIASVIVASIALCAHKRLAWGFAAGTIVLASQGFAPEIWALSRDSFYIAPSIVLIGLLLYAKPGHARKQASLLLWQLLMLLAILLGHSLGIVYATGIFVGYCLTATIRYRLSVVSIPSVWLVGTGIMFGAIVSFARYFGIGAAAMGFYFPFYVDPFQVSVLKSISPFAANPSIATTLSSIVDKNGISGWWLTFAMPALGIVTYRFRQSRLNYNIMLWLILGLTIVACFCIILFLPIKLDGLSLRSAFIANFRYGFGLSILILLFVISSARICIDAFSTHLEQRRVSPIFNVCAAVLLTMAIHEESKVDWTDYSHIYNDIFLTRRAACDLAVNRKPRDTLIDDANMFYVCPIPMTNVYSQKGTQITGVEGEKNIATALDAQQIDAVVFYHSPTWWSGTRLYRYLKAHWVLAYSVSDRAETFLRP